MHVVVTGPMGSGKTTWAAALAEHTGGVVHREPVETNSFFLSSNRAPNAPLERYFAQLHFLVGAAGQHYACQESELLSFQDSSVYDVHGVYNAWLRSVDLLTAAYFRRLQELYEQYLRVLRMPDRIIYVTAPIELLRHRMVARSGTEISTDSGELAEMVQLRERLWLGGDFELIVVDTSTIPAADTSLPPADVARVLDALRLDGPRPS